MPTVTEGGGAASRRRRPDMEPRRPARPGPEEGRLRPPPRAGDRRRPAQGGRRQGGRGRARGAEAPGSDGLRGHRSAACASPRAASPTWASSVRSRIRRRRCPRWRATTSPSCPSYEVTVRVRKDAVKPAELPKLELALYRIKEDLPPEANAIAAEAPARRRVPAGAAPGCPAQGHQARQAAEAGRRPGQEGVQVARRGGRARGGGLRRALGDVHEVRGLEQPLEAPRVGDAEVLADEHAELVRVARSPRGSRSSGGGPDPRAARGRARSDGGAPTGPIPPTRARRRASSRRRSRSRTRARAGHGPGSRP